MPLQNPKVPRTALRPVKKPRLAAKRTIRGERSDERRELIVRMASQLFLKKGYDNVSINEIIELVGGSKATIYAWFGGKEGLFEAVVTQLCQEVTLGIDVDKTGTIEEQLVRIGRSFLELVLSPRILEFHRLMVSIGRTFPGAGRLFFETGPASAYKIVAAWIEHHQKSGALISAEPYRLAVLYLDMLISENQLGWLTSMPRAARPEKIRETADIAARIFLHGCAGKI